MSNTFTTTRARGFTLIELLVVIAIIGLLSTIIAAPIQNARKKARDAKKISELKAVQLALEQYAESNNGSYPTSLTTLSPAYMPILPTFAASTTSSARDAFGYTYYDANAQGGATTTFAYHFGTKLEVFGPALETDRDCTFAILSTQLTSPFCAVYNGEAILATFLNNGTGITATTSTSGFPNAGGNVNGSDFFGTFNATAGNYNEVSTSTCVGANECVFDVTSQQ